MHATPSRKDMCLYTIWGYNLPFSLGLGPLHPNSRMIIGTHVDDFISTNNNSIIKNYFLDTLAISFPYKITTGETMLGFALRTYPDYVELDMAHYIQERLLDKYDLNYLSISPVPMLQSQYMEFRNQYVLETSPKSPAFGAALFQQILGTLTYIGYGIMNEIKNPLRLIAPYGDRPNQIIWDILLQTVRYLKGAKSNGIRYYNCNGDPTITASSDASHAMETKGYSALGTAIHMFGGPMITASRTNSEVYIPTFASELEAIHQTMEEAIQFKELIEEFYPDLPHIDLYNDNSSAVTFGNSSGSKPFKKHHVRTKFLMVQDQVSKGNFKLIHLKNTRLFTDIFTKPLSKKKFTKFRDNLKQGNFPSKLKTK
jgi:hypothetical protein